jgi:hypothetical protein
MVLATASGEVGFVITSRKIKKMTYLIILSILGSFVILKTDVTHADEIETQRLYRSPSYLGRGDAGLALSDNHEAIFYNPAGLARGKGLYKETVFASPSVTASEDTKNIGRKIAVEKQTDPRTIREHVGKNQHVSASNFTGIVFRRMALGVAATSNNNLILQKSPEQRGAEILSAQSVTDIVGTFSLAESFFSEQLLIGTTAKFVSRSSGAVDVNVINSESLDDQFNEDEVLKSLTGYGADLGMMWIMPGKNPFHLGLTVENVGDISLFADDPSVTGEVLHQTVNLGIGFEINSHLSRMLIALDYRDLTNAIDASPYKKIHLGGELAVGSFVGLTGGLNQGYLGGGFYVNLYLLRFDAGSYTQEVGTSAGARPDTRYYFRLMVKI